MSLMNVHETILKRRSIRSFNGEPVSDKALNMLLEAGRCAPTGGNRQPWKFIAVRNPKRIRIIKMFSEGLAGTPTLIIALLTPDKNPITMLDLGMASENIMIQCVELGLGSCAVCSFNVDIVKKLLNIPEDITLVMLLSIGYPEGEPRVRPKKKLEDISYSENYGEALNFE